MKGTKHIVGFSGGIDSQACALWARKEIGENIVLVNSDPGGNEHPLTPAFLDMYSATVFPVTRIHPIIGDMWATPGMAESQGTRPSRPLGFSHPRRA